MLVYLIIQTCVKLKRTKMKKKNYSLMSELEAKSYLTKLGVPIIVFVTVLIFTENRSSFTSLLFLLYTITSELYNQMELIQS